MKKQKCVRALRIYSLALAAFVASGSCAAAEDDRGARLTIEQRRDVEADMSGLAYEVYRGLHKLEGQRAISRPKVSFDQESNVLFVDLGKGAVPKEYTPSLEEQLQLLTNNILTAFQDRKVMPEVKFLFGGHDIYHYFPAEKPEEIEARHKSSSAVRSSVDPVIVVSASHGLHKYNPSNSSTMYWDYQRPFINNVREDLLTPFYADALSAQLTERSSTVTTYLARSTSSDDYIDSCDGTPVVCHPFKDMAARYYLESMLPDRPDIWNSYSAEKPGHKLAHQYDDIRARPRYAIYRQANQLISIHTNAVSNVPQTGASGTRVYYHSGRATSASLATNIACSMRELIRSNASYASWPSSVVAATNYGENAQAGTVPAVVVEVAFHDNPDDATKLQDATFRTLAAKGMEKGSRLEREGKTCAEFQVQADDVSTTPSTSVDVINNYTGNPRFPLTRTSVVKSCSHPGACSGTTTTIQEVASPIKTKFMCGYVPSGETVAMDFEVTWTDADGVKAVHDYKASCAA